MLQGVSTVCCEIPVAYQAGVEVFTLPNWLNFLAHAKVGLGCHANTSILMLE